MGLFSWLRGKKEERALSKSSFGGAFLPANQITPLNETNALTIAAVGCAVNVIASAVAGLPLILYKQTKEGKEPALDHPLYELLLHDCNADMTGFTFKHTLMHHCLLWGDAFAEIERNGAGEPVGLWPLLPNRVRVLRELDGRIIYQVWPYPIGEMRTLESFEVFHIQGISFEGLRGLAPVIMSRQCLELTRHAEEFMASFFIKGSRPSGALKYPGQLSDLARNNLKESWDRANSSSHNAGSVPILEEGLDWQQFDMAVPDEHLNDVRNFQVIDVCRIFNLPPPYVHDLSRATWANLDLLNTYFVQSTLMPWLQRWESEVRRKLLTEKERRKYHAEFDVNRLLRGDMQARFSIYSQALQNGIYSVNEVRGFELLNPVPGGDEHRIQVNLQSASEQPQEENEPKEEAPQEAADTEETND